VYKGSLPLASSQVFVLFVFLMTVILTKWSESQCSLISISMAKNAEHFFTYLLVICPSSLEKCLFSSIAHLLIKLFALFFFFEFFMYSGPQFCSFSSFLLLLFGGVLCFHMNFRIVLSSSVKNVIAFLMGMHWICRLFWVYGHFNNINSSNPWTGEVFPFCVCLPQFHSSVFYIFHCRGFLLPYLNLFLAFFWSGYCRIAFIIFFSANSLFRCRKATDFCVWILYPASLLNF
jgi:hypothetical protein